MKFTSAFSHLILWGSYASAFTVPSYHRQASILKQQTNNEVDNAVDFIQTDFENKVKDLQDGRIEVENELTSDRVIGPKHVLIYDTSLRGTYFVFFHSRL